MEAHFLIKEKRLMDFRNKPGQYLHLVLGDRSGEIEAKIWDGAEDYLEVCQSGRVVFVEGEIVAFRDSMQMKITVLRPAAEEEVRLADFVPCSPRPIEEMDYELRQHIDNLREGALRTLAVAFLDSPWYPMFCMAPAAQSFHHAYAGGLLEHTLGVMKLAWKFSEVHELDRDLLMVGAMFHDVGKVREMELMPGIQYTDEGKFLGHIVLGIQMLDELMSGIEIDLLTRNQVLHMITSHHGEYEWQSPKRPMFLEAKILHLIDMMDAEVFKFKSAVPADEGGTWSNYMKSIGNQVFVGKK